MKGKGIGRPFYVSKQNNNIVYVFTDRDLENQISKISGVKKIDKFLPNGLCVSFKYDVYCNGDNVGVDLFEMFDKMFPLPLNYHKVIEIR